MKCDACLKETHDFVDYKGLIEVEGVSSICSRCDNKMSWQELQDKVMANRNVPKAKHKPRKSRTPKIEDIMPGEIDKSGGLSETAPGE